MRKWDGGISGIEQRPSAKRAFEARELSEHMTTLASETVQQHGSLAGGSIARTSQFMAQHISLAEVLEFRSRNTDGLWSAADEWDRSAEHIGFMLNGELQGVVRINRPVHGRIPLSDTFPSFAVQEGDIQLGKLVVAKEARSTRLVLFDCKSINNILEAHPGRVIATPLAQEEGGLSGRTFERHGFAHFMQPFVSHEHRTLIPMMKMPRERSKLPQLASLEAAA